MIAAYLRKAYGIGTGETEEAGKRRMASSEAARGTLMLSSPRGIFHAGAERGDGGDCKVRGGQGARQLCLHMVGKQGILQLL